MNSNSVFSHKVLTIGCECKSPKGGVAYVLNTYMLFVYSPFKFVPNSCDGNFIKKFWMMLFSYAKCEWLEHTDKDIQFVHIHTASYNSFKRSSLYIRQAKRNGKKAILHIHGGGFREFRLLCPEFVDKYLKMSDAVIALSEKWKQYFTEDVGLKNVYVVNNIISNPQIYKKISDGKFHLLFLGSVVEAKGIFDLLETICEHKEEWKSRVMLHIGGNGKIDLLTNKIKELAISDFVKYEGWVDGVKKAMLFNNADAFILPSYVEGVPISILEAISYGIPVLSTPVGGIPEVVKSGVNGILFASGDKLSMYKAIDMLLNNTKICADMGRQSKRLSKAFLPSNIEKQLINVYNS